MTQEQLKQWESEYGIPDASIRFKGFVQLYRNDLLGLTEHYAVPKRSDISIAYWLESHAFISNVCLWHEFCHAWAWHDKGKTGHGWQWLKRMAGKPSYLLLQIPITIYCVFLKR